MNKLIKLIALTAVAVGISACGKTGDLKEDTTQAPINAQVQTTTVETDKVYCFSGNCFSKPEGAIDAQQPIAPELDILPHNSK
jgi:predicted small lipoprotein YifL